MSRVPVSLRDVAPDDADDVAFLLGLWSDSLRRADVETQLADLQSVVDSVSSSATDRILVAEYDGQPAGAVYLRVSTLSPLSLEPVVQVMAPHVSPSFRRRGIGRALMDASVAYAEELGIAHVSTAVVAGSRDGNRFMARLGLGPQATLRIAPTHAVRAKLTAQLPSRQRGAGKQQLGQVLAARRRTRSGVRAGGRSGVALPREQRAGDA